MFDSGAEVSVSEKFDGLRAILYQFENQWQIASKCMYLFFVFFEKKYEMLIFEES